MTMVPPDDITAAFVPHVAPVVVGVELDGEVVLYNEVETTLHVLNVPAGAIWQRLDGRSDLGLVAADLASSFDVPVDLLMDDVIDAVREFGRQGLLVGVQPDPDAVAANAITPLELDEAPRE